MRKKVLKIEKNMKGSKNKFPRNCKQKVKQREIE
jgi:hypothetical protein